MTSRLGTGISKSFFDDVYTTHTSQTSNESLVMINIICAQLCKVHIHCKKRLAVFLSTAGMSLTRLSLAGNYPGLENLIIPDQEETGR